MQAEWSIWFSAARGSDFGRGVTGSVWNPTLRTKRGRPDAGSLRTGLRAPPTHAGQYAGIFPPRHDRGPGNGQEYNAEVDPREYRDFLQMRNV